PCAQARVEGVAECPAPIGRRLAERLRFVVATMNSTPSSAALIMLLTAFPPAPPTPITVMRGLISDSFWGRLRLMVITALSTQTRGYLLGAAARARFCRVKPLHCHRLFSCRSLYSLWELPFPTQH